MCGSAVSAVSAAQVVRHRGSLRCAHGARLNPLPREQWDDERVRCLGEQTLNIFGTLAHHPNC